MESIAILLSIFSTIVALISAYIAQFKRGKVLIPSIRGYRLEPLNFFEDGNGYRGVRMYILITLMNTGAQNLAVHDLRIRIPITEQNQDLILFWENECSDLNGKDAQFAAQPTLPPYGSCSHVYTFVSAFKADAGKLVSAVEEICTQNPNKIYPAQIQLRTSQDKWQTLCQIAFQHSGRNWLERDFSKINSI